MPFLAIGPCWSCGNLMSFDPDLVPSIVVAGEREPLCEECVQRANQMRDGKEFPKIEPLPGAWGPK